MQSIGMVYQHRIATMMTIRWTMRTCSMTTTQTKQMSNATKELYPLSREQAKLINNLIHKELLEYKHVNNSGDGCLFSLLNSTLTSMDNPQKIERSSEGS